MTVWLVRAGHYASALALAGALLLVASACDANSANPTMTSPSPVRTPSARQEMKAYFQAIEKLDPDETRLVNRASDLIHRAGHSSTRKWSKLAQQLTRHSDELQDLAVDYAVIDRPREMKRAHSKMIDALRDWSEGADRLADHLRSENPWTPATWKAAVGPFLRGNRLYGDWVFSVKVAAKRYHLKRPWKRLN